MAEHVSPQELEAYRLHALGPERVTAVAQHLAACEACRVRGGSERALDAAFTGLSGALEAAGAEGSHLGYEQIEAHVDGLLDETDTEVVTTHLEDCPACTAIEADLRALRPSPSSPAATPKEKGHGRSWPSLAAQVLGSAAAAGGVAWLVSLSLRSDVRDVKGRLAELEGTSARRAAAASDAKPAPSAAVLLTDGGSAITADAGHRYRGLPDLPAPIAEAVTAALTRRRVEVPTRLAELGGRRETLMGAADEGVPFALLQPVGAVVETPRPTLRWRRLPGAESYVAVIYDAQLRRVARSPSLARTEWTPPGALAPGAAYTWQVVAVRSGEDVVSPSAPAPEARFEVLSDRQREELQKARAAHGDWHLVMAVLYARAGLVADAERELVALGAANPGSPLVRDLLDSLPRRR